MIKDILNKTVSDIIDVTKLNPKKINIIEVGCSFGKSYFAIMKLIEELNTIDLSDDLKHLKNIKPNEILMVTSRVITQEQQANSYKDVAFELNSNNFSYYRRSITKDEGWFGSVKEKIDKIGTKIPITNYNFFNCNFDDEMLSNIKIVVFDEIHALTLDNYNEHMKEVYDNLDNYIEKGILIIGMSATIDKSLVRRKSRFNFLLDEPLYKYKITNTFNVVAKKSYAKNIILNLEGKSLVMCFSAKDAIRLADEIPNSRALVSRYNPLRTEEMNELENYIIKNKDLPEGVKNYITTSCSREGMEFKKESNIKNVVVYSSCVTEIIQFLGRFRGDLDNIYIVNEPFLNIKKVNNKLSKQQRQYHQEFKNLIYNNDYTWTHYFSNIVSKDIKLNIINEEVMEQKFIDFMLENYTDTLIYTKEQKQEIVDKAFSLNLKYTKNNHKHNFNSLIKLIKQTDVEFVFSGELKSTNNKTIKKYIPNENRKNIRPYLFKFTEDEEMFLNDLIGKRLYKEQQEEIKQKFNCRQVNKLNDILKKYNLSIESKQAKENGIKMQVWIINKI